MIYCFDLDDTLIETHGGDYAASKPIQDNINKVNELYKKHTIIINTGRAEIWEDFTKIQLMTFKIKYHVLVLGKPYADLYIDDKGTNIKDFF